MLFLHSCTLMDGTPNQGVQSKQIDYLQDIQTLNCLNDRTQQLNLNFRGV